jgi:predicted ArsR family transcriptional regulator
MQNLQFRTVDNERTFEHFCDGELENNRSGIVRWNKLEVVERTARRFEIRVTRCLFHELATAAGAPELTPAICQVDNAFFNSYLPDVMTYQRGGPGRRIADGAKECNFVWELHQK